MTSRRWIAVILSPVGLLLLSAARLIVVAGYNTTTAITIATSGGYINTLLGSTIPLIPVFAPYLALILLLFRRFFLSVLVFVFAAFFTPTPVPLPELLRLAKADWDQIIADISIHRMAAIIFLLIVVAILWNYHRSLAEAMSVVVIAGATFALLYINPHQSVLPEAYLRPANKHVRQGEHQIHIWASSDRLLTFVVVAVVVFALVAYYSTLTGVVTTIVALGATIALFPYVYAIYPVPHQENYYVRVLHELWLPAERITINSDRVYRGYVLAESPAWFTILRTNEKVAYIPVDDVVSRSVCQPATNPKPPPYPPLITTLYTKPLPTPPCSAKPVAITSFISGGQSLKRISSVTHRSTWSLISVTNSHENFWLSAALRRYERARNWGAPTPVGQRFWYYPRTKR
jgi:hypothetical protein